MIRSTLLVLMATVVGTACGASNEAECTTDVECPGVEVCINGTCVEVDAGSQCFAGQQECNGTCISTTSDPQNCGGCGNTCRTDQFCSDSTCKCSVGEACGDACVNTLLDPQNCGFCGNPCDSTQSCDNGTCRDNCSDGTTSCGGSCVNTNTNKQFCGDCDTECGLRQTCVSGTCTNCPAGQTGCTDDATGVAACVDTNFDPRNCDTCGNDCGADGQCIQGNCYKNCPSGQTPLCNGECISTRDNHDYCGASCADCASQNLCCFGDSCRAGTTDDVCGPNCDKCGDRQSCCGGKCVDWSSANCGKCGSCSGNTPVCQGNSTCREEGEGPE